MNRRGCVSALIATATAYACPLKAAALSIGDVVPALVFTSGDGKAFSLSSLAGNVVLVNFWATWCGACVSELPSLERLYQKVASEPGLRILAVAVDEGMTPGALLASWRRMGLTLPAALDSTGMAGKYFNLRVLPTSFILDKEGRVRHVIVGARDWSSDRWVRGLVAFRDGRVP